MLPNETLDFNVIVYLYNMSKETSNPTKGEVRVAKRILHEKKPFTHLLFKVIVKFVMFKVCM